MSVALDREHLEAAVTPTVLATLAADLAARLTLSLPRAPAKGERIVFGRITGTLTWSAGSARRALVLEILTDVL